MGHRYLEDAQVITLGLGPQARKKQRGESLRLLLSCRRSRDLPFGKDEGLLVCELHTCDGNSR